MALIEGSAIASGVHDTEWQRELKALGVTQKEFARLFGLAENTVSRQMREEWPMPVYVRALILALKHMPERQRADWLAELRKREKPSKG